MLGIARYNLGILLMSGAVCAHAPVAFGQDAPAVDAAADASVDAPAQPAEADPAPAEADASPLDLAQQRLEEKLERKRQAEADQLDAARSLADALDQILDLRGMMIANGSADQRDLLIELATRAGLLTRSTTSTAARFLLLQTQARAYNALATEAGARNEELEFTRRLRQLRSTGQLLRAMDEPIEAPSTGAYWVLLADLADTNRGDSAVEDRQALAREILAGYIESFEDDSAAADLLIDARLSLAWLHDQSGNQVAVADQLSRLADLPAPDPRSRSVDALRASLDRIGRVVELDTVTTSGSRWRLSDYDDGPVLLHLYADGAAGNDLVFDGLMRKIARSARGGFTVASLRVGPAVNGSRLPAWPTLVVPGREVELLQTLGVTAAPTFVWIDRHHRIAAIGQTLEVFERRPTDRPPPIEAHAPEADPQANPDHDPAPAPPAPAAE